MKARTTEEIAKPTALVIKTSLSNEEAVELKQLEQQVEQNLAEFQHAAFQIGSALSIINQKKLYRSTHKTFQAYVSERFGLSRPHAYSVMVAAKTFEALTEGQQFDAKDLPSITAAESIARGVDRLLREAQIEDSAEQAAVTRQIARNVYNLAVQNAPKDKAGQPVLSPAHIKSVFAFLNDVARTGVVEIDGVQVALNLAAVSFEEMIGEGSAERLALLKQRFADDFDKNQEFAESTPDADESDPETGMRNWRIAELHIAECLRAMKDVRSVDDVSEKNLGHDLEAIFEDGRKIYIEAKMVKSFNEPFKLTNNEFSSAQIFGKDYYLAVIINGEQPQIKFISNPIEKLSFEKVYERVALRCKKYSNHLEDEL